MNILMGRILVSWWQFLWPTVSLLVATFTTQEFLNIASKLMPQRITRREHRMSSLPTCVFTDEVKSRQAYQLWTHMIARETNFSLVLSAVLHQISLQAKIILRVLNRFDFIATTLHNFAANSNSVSFWPGIISPAILSSKKCDEW